MNNKNFLNDKNRNIKTMTARYQRNRTEWTFKLLWVKTVTVFIYLICVSLPAIVLGVYYLYSWQPSMEMFKTIR